MNEYQLDEIENSLASMHECITNAIKLESVKLYSAATWQVQLSIELADYISWLAQQDGDTLEKLVNDIDALEYEWGIVYP